MELAEGWILAADRGHSAQVIALHLHSRSRG
jgi:hypothetical protein